METSKTNMSELYENMIILKEKGLLEDYFTSALSCLLHTFFNPMLTIISMVIFVFYSGIFSVKIMPLQEFIIYVIFTPIFITGIFWILFSIVFIYCSKIKVLNPIKEIEKEKNIDKRVKKQNDFVNHDYKKTLEIWRIIPILLYVIIAVSIYYAATMMPPISDYITKEGYLLLYVIIGSFIFGFLWSQASYHSLNRTNRNKIFVEMDKKSCIKKSFTSLVNQTKYEALAIIIVILQIIYVYFFLSNKGQMEEITGNSLMWLNILITIIITLVLTYVRLLYKLQYSKKSDSIVFPYFGGLFDLSNSEIVDNKTNCS